MSHHRLSGAIQSRLARKPKYLRLYQLSQLNILSSLLLTWFVSLISLEQVNLVIKDRVVNRRTTRLGDISQLYTLHVLQNFDAYRSSLDARFKLTRGTRARVRSSDHLLRPKFAGATCNDFISSQSFKQTVRLASVSLSDWF